MDAATDSRFRRGLYWFTNDLRLADNRALLEAAARCERLLCVYIVDPLWFRPNRYGLKSIGDSRWQFLQQSLDDLDSALRTLGQQLIVLYQSPLDAMATTITEYGIDAIFRSQNAGYYENQEWQTLQRRYRMLHFEEHATHTLYNAASLPFPLEQLPASFTQFRKRMEPFEDFTTLAAPQWLPAPPLGAATARPDLPPLGRTLTSPGFSGGARHAQAHLRDYLKQRLPSQYKVVRNALDGWENSTKFSPWLAAGCLSAKQVFVAIDQYERDVESNESTYWIKFELLWREYFQWYAHAQQQRLFKLEGIKGQATLTSFYPERFQRWCNGNTPFPLVNACMRQLNQTGYMSNRGRQVVASCFVNELGLDWRYGAAYFEQQLIDYDVASNWGNWQYLAGVGADPRGKRHFDINKQAATYDPEGAFTRRWRGDTQVTALDSIDAADWPIA